jgi:hypothetical protein
LEFAAFEIFAACASVGGVLIAAFLFGDTVDQTPCAGCDGLSVGAGVVEGARGWAGAGRGGSAIVLLDFRDLGIWGCGVCNMGCVSPGWWGDEGVTLGRFGFGLEGQQSLHRVLKFGLLDQQFH